jgi:hypothetical protein
VAVAVILYVMNTGLGFSNGTVQDLALEATQDEMSRPDMMGSSVGRMRRRFHELLDDAFSLFGSRSGSPVAEDSSSPPALHRVNSAIVRCVCMSVIWDQYRYNTVKVKF